MKTGDVSGQQRPNRRTTQPPNHPAIIDERTAWAILDRYVQDCLNIDRDSLLAVYATGSLGGGYYRPGQSDIDAVLIVQDGSEGMWGDLGAGSAALAALNRAYKERHQIPKDFGPFALQEHELYPPYSAESDVLTLEIARLKVQGVCVYGKYDLAMVPMPAAEDFRQDARRFERWMRDEFLKSNPIATWSGAACVNTILMVLGHYLRIERGVIEFDKRLLIARYLENEPPFVDEEAFCLVDASLAGQDLSEKEEERLREAVKYLRAQMNAHLGIQTHIAPAKASLPGVRADFPDRVDRWIDRYRPALETLAKGRQGEQTMTENPKATFDQLCAFVQGEMAKKGVPGVALGVLYANETYTAGFGVTNADHPMTVTDETFFQIGSITKTFTCLAVMRLVERGKLDLQSSVRTYLPSFRVADETASAQVTIWHLLTHMSGWEGDLFRDTGAGDDAMARYMAEMVDLEQLAPLGTAWSYNNAGFCLAGYVIEQVTGQRYEAAMQELVFQPLGLERCLFDPGDVITHRFVVGHHAAGSEAQVLRPWPLPRAAYPAGGITTDVHDLLRYARFQMGDGSVADSDKGERVQVLQAETLSSMHTPQANRHGETEQIGLSWFIDDAAGTRQLSHGGGTTGQLSVLAIFPEQLLAVAVLTNADAGGAITDGVRRWVVEHYLGLHVPKPEPIEASQEDLATYVGFYARPSADVELGMLNGRLVAQMVFKQGFPSQDSPTPPPPPPSALALCAHDRLLVVAGASEGSQVDVIRKPDGSIGWLRTGGRIYRRAE